MGLIQDIFRKWKENKEEKKHLESVADWEHGIQQKRLSANERMLLRHREKERQERIKLELHKIKRQEQDEMWRGKKHNPIFAPNIVRDNKNIFSNHKKIFSGSDNLFTKRDNFLNWNS